MDFIPVLRPLLPKTAKLNPYLEQIDHNRYYSNMGPLSQLFEHRLAAHFGVDPDTLVTSANGTLALTQILKALKVKPGTFCIMPSWTFAATPAAAVSAGLEPFFIDVDRKQWIISPEDILPHLDGREVGAVIPVAPFGAPLDVDAWERFVKNTGIPVVIDAAAAFDSFGQISRAKTRTVPIMISLHATKAMGIGEGAVILAGRTELAQSIRMYGNFGFHGNREALVPGINAKLNEYMSAVGLAALDEWPTQREEWRKLSERFETHVGKTKGASCSPDFNRTWISSYGNIVLNTHHEAALVQKELARQGIGSVRWWGGGCHKQKAYAECPRVDLPVTEELGNSVLGLPFWLGLDEAQSKYVFSVLATVLADTMERRDHA